MHWPGVPPALAARLRTADEAEALILKLLKKPPMTGVRKLKGSATLTVMLFPIPLPPGASLQPPGRAVPDGSAQTAVTVIAFSPPCPCTFVSCRAWEVIDLSRPGQSDSPPQTPLPRGPRC